MSGCTPLRMTTRIVMAAKGQDRFPADFRFQLTAAEKAEVVAKCDHLGKLKFSPQLPFAFTEHGAIMAAIRQLMSPPEEKPKRRIGFSRE